MSEYLVLADLVMLVHAGFVVFVAFGVLVARRRPWLRRLHLTAVSYAVAFTAFRMTPFRWRCPLTYAENAIRAHAGQRPDEPSFLAQLVEPIIYRYDVFPPAVLLLGTLLILGASLAVYYGGRFGGAAGRRDAAGENRSSAGPDANAGSRYPRTG